MVGGRERATKDLWSSFRCALNGAKVAWTQERNFRIQCLYASGVLAGVLVCRPGIFASALVLFTVATLLGSELANSALERAVDLAVAENHALAAAAKDMAAAGVLLVSFGSAVVVASVFWPCWGEGQQEFLAWMGLGLCCCIVLRLRS